MDESFKLSIRSHSQFSCLPTSRGNHCIFVITVQKCKCDILKLGLVHYDLFHQYLYALLIFPLCEIRNSEQYRVIVGFSPTPGLQVSAISCEYYYYGCIHVTDFSCCLLFGFYALILLQHNNTEQQYLVIILNTKCERWKSGWFKGQADCCERGRFIVINWPVLLWLSFLWYGTHPVFEW